MGEIALDMTDFFMHKQNKPDNRRGSRTDGTSTRGAEKRSAQ